MTAQALGPSGHRTRVTLDPFLSLPLPVVFAWAKRVWLSGHRTRYFSPFMDKRAITTISRHSPRETRVISPP